MRLHGLARVGIEDGRCGRRISAKERGMLRTSIFLCTVAVVFAATRPAAAQLKDTPQDLTLRGKIVKVEAPDRFVVRTSDNKEVIVYTNPQTRYIIDGKAGRYADLRIGTEINTVYV